MKKSLIKKIKNNKNFAVSEVIGTVLLLGISVTLFSIVYVLLLSNPLSPPTPTSNIVYSFDNKNLTLTNIGGKPLATNTQVKILINNEFYKSYKVGDYLEANESNWEIGKQLTFDLSENITDVDYLVEVQVIDVNSNSIIIMGKTSIKNRPPTISSPEPYNNQNSIPITFTSLDITISEPDNDAFRWTIQTQPDIGSNYGVMQVYIQDNFKCSISGLVEDTNYTWYVNTTDINGKSTTKTYTFTTGTTSPSEEEHKDAIDNNSSDVDSSVDIGTEIDFNNCKSNTTDNNVMIITEYKKHADDTNDTVDDNTANKDASAD